MFLTLQQNRLPYIFAIGLFIGLYEWIRVRFHN
ncbi:DUF334 domain-containing protein [Staphylococcus epidermidis]|nr:DUF334 domain-containing protein [Staphylococcus epidermidis]